MFKIQTLNTISPLGLEQFPETHYAIANDTQQPDALILRSYNLHGMVIPASVKAVGRAGAGVNNIPVAELTQRGIPVFNTPGANANAVRELVLAGMLLASRHLCEAWDYVQHLQVSEEELPKAIEEHKKQFVGFELAGKTLGVIGLGSVGVKVANAAISLGMRVIGYDPTITVNRAWELSANVQQARSVEDLLGEADFLTLHVPLNAATKHMINAERLKRLRPNVVILNFARDGIIDEDALLAALDAKQVFAYVTDFPTAQLQRHARVINLPHLGASTREAEENCAVMIAKQLREFLEQGVITNAVNFPAVDVAPLIAGTRLVIANANVPNMVAQISTCLAAAQLNIQSLVNKSQGEMAYTVIDVEGDVSPEIQRKVEAIEGVVQVRLIHPK